MRRNTIDSERFDEISRKMAGGSSRRTLLRGAFGGALAALGLAGTARDGAAKADKVDICHYDADTGTYHRISVSTNALNAHVRHGDDTSIGCAEGHELNLETCECAPVLAPVTPCSNYKESCGDRALYLNSVNGGCVCVDAWTTTVCPGLDCASDSDCPEHDHLELVCITDDDTCDGRNHCHPLA